MPRHGTLTYLHTAPSARHSGEEFLESRKPRVLYVTPEPVWILDSYRVKRWYYRAAPDVGEKVHYLEDGFATRVKRVTPFAIYFDDANVMRRPYIAGRLLGWSLPRLQRNLSRITQHGSQPSPAGRTPTWLEPAGSTSTGPKGNRNGRAASRKQLIIL